MYLIGHFGHIISYNVYDLLHEFTINRNVLFTMLLIANNTPYNKFYFSFWLDCLCNSCWNITVPTDHKSYLDVDLSVTILLMRLSLTTCNFLHFCLIIRTLYFCELHHKTPVTERHKNNDLSQNPYVIWARCNRDYEINLALVFKAVLEEMCITAPFNINLLFFIDN